MFRCFGVCQNSLLLFVFCCQFTYRYAVVTIQMSSTMHSGVGRTSQTSLLAIINVQCPYGERPIHLNPVQSDPVRSGGPVPVGPVLVGPVLVGLVPVGPVLVGPEPVLDKKKVVVLAKKVCIFP